MLLHTILLLSTVPAVKGRLLLLFYVCVTDGFHTVSIFLRVQHVHSCLLKQSSSAKKAPPPPPPTATAPVTPARQTPGNAIRVGAGGSGYGNIARSGVGETGPSAFGQGREGRETPGHSASSASDADADTADSPRSTRVSLQWVFSPKVGGNDCFSSIGTFKFSHQK